MTEKIELISKNENYTAVNLGCFDDLHKHENGKIFIKDSINATGAEISFQLVPPRTALPFFHSHKQNEEIYVIVKGEGQYQVDDDIIPLKEGSVVRVAPKGERSLNNTSDNPMVYMVIQAKENSLEQYTIADGLIIERKAKWS